MEFIAEKSELSDELDLIQGAVEKKSTIPILSHFVMEATGSRLQITASDLELAAQTSCVHLEQGRLEISSGGEYGDAHEVVDIGYGGTTLSIGFNYHYLLDFFGAVVKTGAVRMELKDEQNAVQFCPVDQGTYGYKYLLMPLRV